MTRGTFQQIVNADAHEQLVAVALSVNQTLVGIDHLLEVDWLADIMREGCFTVEVVIVTFNLFNRRFALDNLCSKDTTWKVAPLGDEVNLTIKGRL